MAGLRGSVKGKGGVIEQRGRMVRHGIGLYYRSTGAWWKVES